MTSFLFGGGDRARGSLAFQIMLALSALLLWAGSAAAHAVAEGDKGYIQEISGVNLIPFIYLGAKHMVTGYARPAQQAMRGVSLVDKSLLYVPPQESDKKEAGGEGE